MGIILSVLLSYRVVERIKCKNLDERAKSTVHIIYLWDAIFIINGLRALFSEQTDIANSTLSHIASKDFTTESDISLFFHLKISKPFPQSLITKCSEVQKGEMTRLILLNKSSPLPEESIGFCLKWRWKAEWPRGMNTGFGVDGPVVF